MGKGAGYPPWRDTIHLETDSTVTESRRQSTSLVSPRRQPHCKLGLAQVSPRLGDVAANVEMHLAYIEQARDAGVDLLIFPELSLTGYYVKDLVPDVAWRCDDPSWEPLLAASHDLPMIVGFAEESERQQFYIAAAYLEGGRIRHVHRKVYPATYGIFDDGRFFGAGDRMRAFDSRCGRAAILICEDLWHPAAAVIASYDGAEVLIGISSSPGRGTSESSPDLDSALAYERIGEFYSQFLTCYVVHCNRVGYEDGISFFGGSSVFGPDGQRLAHGPYYEECLVTAKLSPVPLRRQRSRLPLLRDERLDLTYRELARIYRSHYDLP